MSARINIVSKPRKRGNYPDRDIECQEAVAAGIVDLIEAAENAGWSASEAAAAIFEVSRGFVLQTTGREPDE